MKLRDWYDFNFGNKQLMCNIGDIYVKVFRKESYKNEDVILETLMKPKNDYCTLKVCICKADYKDNFKVRICNESCKK